MPNIDYSNEQIQQLIDGIFNRVVGVQNLPRGLYRATVDILKGGLYEGFKGQLSDFEFGTPDHELLNELRDNIYMFSGAKTFQQVQHISSLLYTKNLDYKIFKEEALKVYKNYNENYLESEYVTAITSGTSAKSYNEAVNSNGLFNRLKYTAIIDSHTSEICKRLNGIVLPVDDKFWSTNTPPNHFNCRCFIEKLDKYDTEKSSPNYDVKPANEYAQTNRQPVFNMNPATDKVVFREKGKDKHPYFIVPKQYKDLAKKNFNLPIPDKD